MIPSRYRGIENTQKEINAVLDKIKESIHEILFELSDGGTYLDVERQKVEDKIFKSIDKYKAKSEE